MNISDSKIAALLLVISFPLYLYTMSPSVSVGDSGEFIASASTLSLPHAPSYPLFTCLGKCAMILFPFANTAYRVNLISVFFGIGSALLCFIVLRQLRCSLAASLAAALCFLLSKVMWEHSVTTEVFSLNTFFVLLIVSAFYFRREVVPAGRRLMLAAFLLGLGMGNHHTLVLTAPLVALLYLDELVSSGTARMRALQSGLAQLPPAFIFFCLGFTVYAFLPIRSFKNPPIDWSNPETINNFIRVITRADYGSLALTLGEKMPRNMAAAAMQVERYFSYLIQDIGWIGFAAGLLGWIVWFLRSRFEAFSFFAFFVLSGIGFLVLGNLPFDSQSSGILPRFYMMPAVPFLIALGCGLNWLTEKRKRIFSPLAFGLPLALVFKLHGHPKFSRSDFAAYDYGVNLLRTLPPQAALFMDGGDDTFYTLAYLTMSEKRRADLEIHDRGGLIYKNPYGDDFRKITKDEKNERRQQVESSYLGLRPLFYSTFDKNVLRNARCVQRGILYEALPLSGGRIAPKELWKCYSYRGVYEINPDQPYRLRALAPLYAYLEGLDRWDEALLQRAAGYGMDIAWIKGNLVWEYSIKAYEHSSQNRAEDAEKLYRKIIQMDPKFVNAYTNLGVLLERKNETAEAESCYRKACEIDPKCAEAYYNLGVLYWRQNRWEDVMQMFEKTMQLAPNHPSAGRYLYIAQRKLLQERRGR